MEEQLETTDSLNGDLETADSQNGEEEVDVEAIKKENAELKKTNQELYEREKKAKGFVRGTDGKWIKPEPKEPKEEKTETKSDDGLSTRDTVAIMRNNVHEDDIEKVKKAAKVLGLEVADALKDDIVKGILKRSEEERTSANASHTGGGGKVTSKMTDESLLNEAMEGKPPVDDAGIDRFVKARLAKKIDDIKNRTQ